MLSLLRLRAPHHFLLPLLPLQVIQLLLQPRSTPRTPVQCEYGSMAHTHAPTVCGPTHSPWHHKTSKKLLPKPNRFDAKDFWLFETVTQGDATSRAWQFAQRLRNTADEELVVPLETSVAAPHREPDFAEDFFNETECRNHRNVRSRTNRLPRVVCQELTKRRRHP